MQKNTQVPKKKALVYNGTYGVNQIFHTIQGEGPFAGTPAIFVRLSGCNLQCPMCDTEYSRSLIMTEKQILCAVQQLHKNFGCNSPGEPWIEANCNLVVISGGEPFRQIIGPLVSILLDNGYNVQVETNGTLFQKLPFENERLMIVCSPKTGSVNRSLAPYIFSYKYVATKGSLEDSHDGLPIHALEHPNSGMLARPPEGFEGPIYLQPVDEKDQDKNAKNLEAVVRSCLQFGYKLCIQLHKIIGVE